MSQLSSRETSDMDIDDESFDQTSQYTKSPIACPHSFLNSDSDTASVKSVDELIENDKDSHDYYTDEESYLYRELYENDPGTLSASSQSDTHPEEESCIIEEMSIDDESFLETKENVNPKKSTDITTSVKNDHPRQKRLYQQ